MTDSSGDFPVATDRRNSTAPWVRLRVACDDGNGIGLLIGCAVSVVFLYSGVPAAVVIPWLAALVLASLYGAYVSRSYGPADERPSAGLHKLVAAVARGLVWGGAGAALFYHPGSDATVPVVVAVAGATLANARVASGDLKLLLCTVFPALGPVALFFLSRADVASQAAGALVMMFGVTLIQSVRRPIDPFRAAGDLFEQNGGSRSAESKLAVIDPLSRGWSRRRFRELLDQEFYRSRRYGHALSVAKFAPDDAEALRSRHGRSAVNRCLRELSDLISREIRQSDVWVRHDGDSFLLMLPDTGSEEAVMMCRRLWEEAARVYVPAGSGPGSQAIRLSISVGIAGCTPEDRTIHALLTRVEAALRDARGRVNGAVVFADSPSAELQVIEAG